MFWATFERHSRFEATIRLADTERNIIHPHTAGGYGVSRQRSDSRILKVDRNQKRNLAGLRVSRQRSDSRILKDLSQGVLEGTNASFEATIRLADTESQRGTASLRSLSDVSRQRSDSRILKVADDDV